jgi:hypothetical protein
VAGWGRRRLARSCGLRKGEAGKAGSGLREEGAGMAGGRLGQEEACTAGSRLGEEEAGAAGGRLCSNVLFHRALGEALTTPITALRVRSQVCRRHA